MPVFLCSSVDGIPVVTDNTSVFQNTLHLKSNILCDEGSAERNEPMIEVK